MSEEITPTKPNYSNIVTPKQFIFWSIGSFGLFDKIWAYRNRKHFQQLEWSKIMPFWRAVFNRLRAVPLFKKIKTYSNNKGYSWSFSPRVLGLLYLFLGINITSNGLGWISTIVTIWAIILSIVSALLVLKPLNALNYYHQQIEKNTIERPIQRRHYLLIILYIIIWWLVIWSIIIAAINPELITQ